MDCIGLDCTGRNKEGKGEGKMEWGSIKGKESPREGKREGRREEKGEGRRKLHDSSLNIYSAVRGNTAPAAAWG